MRRDLAAFGAMEALRRRATEGGSYLVRLSLVQTAHWIKRLGRLPEGQDARDLPDPTHEDVMDLTMETESAFGTKGATSMPTSPKKTSSPTADFLARAIEFSGKSQREIAEEVGIGKPNFVSMLKTGRSPVPIDRVPALAKATHVDPAYFLRLALQEYHPEVWSVIVNALGEPLTANEWEMVLLYRLASEDEEIEIDADVAHAVLDALIGFKKGPRTGH